jgi:hypothetical protein
MRKTQAVAAVAAVLIAGGAVVATFDGVRSGGTDMRRDSKTQSANNLSAGGASVAEGSFDAAAVPQAAAESHVTPASPRVVKTAQLELSMRSNESVTKATQRANHIAEARGGFVSSTEESKSDARQTTLTLRVPVDQYDAALSELRALGKVTSESLGGKDVTGTLVDLEARLRTLRAQEEALNALVGKARTVGETLEVAREAANVRMQIEQLAAQQAQLADQADFATISLHVVGPNVAIEKDPSPQPLLADALERAAGGTLAVFGGVIVLLGYAIPSAALAALGYGIWRLVNRRKQTAVPVAS